MGRQESAAPAQDRYPPLQPDADLGDVMGAWTSPKRFGHYGLMSDVSTIAYEPTNVSISSLIWIRLLYKVKCRISAMSNMKFLSDYASLI